MSDKKNNKEKKILDEDDFLEDEELEIDDIKDALDDNQEDQEEIDNEADEEISTGIPEVASSPQRNILILVAIIIFGVVVLIIILSGGDDNNQQLTPDQITNGGSAPPQIPSAPIPPAAITQDIQPLPLPGIPDAEYNSENGPAPLPAIEVPPPNISNGTGEVTIESPPDLPPAPPIPIPQAAETTSSQGDETIEARRKSAMVVISRNFTRDNNSTTEDKDEEEKNKPERIKSRNIGDTTQVIAQGKIIDAVLETAVNTDLPGVLRAVVSRDVYAESGRNILIKKGSRLIGSYNADVKRGQGRVFIIWNRVIMPDGNDVQIESPGTDQMGRTGLNGRIDNRYLEIFGNSILLSSLNFGVAALAEGATGSEGVEQTQNLTGSITTTGSASDFALQDSISSIGSVISGVAGDLVNIRPRITINQGTKIKVFVNKDLAFGEDEENEQNGQNSTTGSSSLKNIFR